MSSSNIPSSEGSAHAHLWQSQHQLPIGCQQYNDVQNMHVEPSHSTPNFTATSSFEPNVTTPMNNYPLAMEYNGSYFTADAVPMSLGASSRSSASDAVQGDLPSPLEHISQQAAAYRSLVASTPRSAPRARLVEVMARIDLNQQRRAAAIAAGLIVSPPVSPSTLPLRPTPVARYTIPPRTPTVPRYAAPPTSSPAPRYAVDFINPASPIGPSARSFSASFPAQYPLMRDSALYSLQPDSIPQPMVRHQRSLLATMGIEPMIPLVTRTTRSAEPLTSLREAEDRALALVEDPADDSEPEPEAPAHAVRNLDHMASMGDRTLNSHETLGFETLQIAEDGSVESRLSEMRLTDNYLADNRVAEAARVRHAHASNRPIDYAQDAPVAMLSTHSTNMQAINLAQELTNPMPSERTADLHHGSIVLPRQRPAASARDPYARNNEFLARMASGERLDDEIGPLQRPTPPPAIGHGRPVATGNRLPQTRSRPSQPLPHWQRDQENSEEAAMSRFQEDMRDLMVNQANNNADHDDGIMDDTPPREHPMGRYLRD